MRAPQASSSRNAPNTEVAKVAVDYCVTVYLLYISYFNFLLSFISIGHIDHFFPYLHISFLISFLRCFFLPPSFVFCSSIEICNLHVSRDIAVGIATGYGLDSRGIGVRVASRQDHFWDPVQWVPEAISLGVKRPGLEAGPLISNWCRDQEHATLYIHFPICLHGLFN
jgi:hypothetical protein